MRQLTLMLRILLACWSQLKNSGCSVIELYSSLVWLTGKLKFLGVMPSNLRTMLFHELFKFSSVEYSASLESKVLANMYLDGFFSRFGCDTGRSI